MTRIELDVPAAAEPAARYAIETLLSACAGAPAAVAYPSAELPASERGLALLAGGDDAAVGVMDDGHVDLGDGRRDLVASAFWHLARLEERRPGERDRHGRFPAARSLADPGRPAVDALLRRFREALAAGAPDGFRVVLTHDVDVPWRWSGRRAVRAAAGRLARATLERRGGDALADARGLAALPLRVATRSDPEWAFGRIRRIERRHGARSTYFVLGGHAHPADGPSAEALERLRPRVVAEVGAGGDEVALHPSYRTSEEPDRLAAELRGLEALAGGRVRGARFHYLRHDTHATLPLLERVGLRYDSSAGYAERPGMRAGFSFPYRPYSLAAGRPLELVEIPLAVMDATLAERRYLGLDVRAGLRRAIEALEPVAAVGGTVAVLWHNDRFSPEYARGWDGVYDRLLGWVRDRGGTLCAAEDVLPALRR
jgi:peptidoglycan/xylan/chitin deacetylase (PgdA/CDA1 family)